MKRLLLFFVLVIGLDQACGHLLNWLYFRTTTGEMGGLINDALRRTPDVLVLGSSRAQHHVSAAILRSRLSLSVYNAGINGSDFLYAMMLLDLRERSGRPLPKVILWQVDSSSLARVDDEIQKSSLFSAYIGDSTLVRSVILMRGKYEAVKYLSYSYRFNGKVLPIVKNLFSHPDPEFDGYVGLRGVFRVGLVPDQHSGESARTTPCAFWDMKIRFLEELARRCKANGTHLILFHSPSYDEDPVALHDWLVPLNHLHVFQDGAEFLDLREPIHRLFDGRPELFKDAGHLNSKGAEIFSAMLAEEIANRIGATPAPRG